MDSRSFRLEAIVLRHANWGEADRLLTLYTRERGKVRAVAKGIRKIKSRKAGHLEPFTRVILQVARGRDLLVVTQAEAIDTYQPLRMDLLKMGYASYLVELLDRFTYEEESENNQIFRLLTETLARLTTEPEPWLTLRYYEMRLLENLGFRPQLFTCANCREEIKAVDQYFSAVHGGVLCPRCGSTLPDAWAASMEALKYLRHFQRSNYSEAKRAQPKPQVRNEVEALMQRYITYLLERELNTPGFIRQVIA